VSEIPPFCFPNMPSTRVEEVAGKTRAARGRGLAQRSGTAIS
jgi:hypothetical protein